ncbi:hypothetical protein [Endozoicomonas numazuensis]|uniref:Uncharacterized protein n=1 Tax=Endozoicomonas numazuensis TaxID=1137799 RepID=A0A081NL02_9GAMM|nr:hypothetical protein [Endozoicomonas numazuensis]KEQ19125.1 hypothetical protein GZ78_03720 [Endozoicomonas numazuensis]
MAIEDINNRPVQPSSVKQDPELGVSGEQQVEEEVESTFEDLKSNMEEMLQFNYAIIHELLGQIAAISPYRADMAQGKQPEVAAIEASDSAKATPVAPVGEASASAYLAGLQHIEGMMGNHDIKLQEMFDKLALSRSGRKSDLKNQGLEFERLKSIIIQAEGRMNQTLSQMPETLPEHTGRMMKDMLPEFIEKLQKYDGSFREALTEVREEILRVSSHQ